VKAEKLAELASKGSFQQCFEEAWVGCESAAVCGWLSSWDCRQARCGDRSWLSKRGRPTEENHLCDRASISCTWEQEKFLTVVSNLETDEPLWFGQRREERSAR